jgi:predicted secreted protein
MMARVLSIVFHPFVMVGLMVGVAVATQRSGEEALESVAAVLLFTVVPLAVLMIRQVRRGVWESADASNRRERPVLFATGIVGLVALLSYLTLMRQQTFLVRGVVVTLGLIAACGLATVWIKVSLHMAIATYAAATLALMRSPVGFLLILALPALAWSRLTLERHTLGEIAAGAAVGAVAAGVIHYF